MALKSAEQLEEKRKLRERLVELYREKRVLWDPTDKSYRNKPEKYAAYKAIATVLKISVQEVKNDLKFLRLRFFREYKRATTKVNADASASYNPNFWLYNELLFLAEARAMLPSTSKIDQSDYLQAETDDESKPISSGEAAVQFTSSIFGIDALAKRKIPSKVHRPLRRKKSAPALRRKVKSIKVKKTSEPTRVVATVGNSAKQEELDSSIKTCFSQLAEVFRNGQEDDLDHFGKFIAAQLRQKPSLQQSSLRNQIYTLVCCPSNSGLPNSVQILDM